MKRIHSTESWRQQLAGKGTYAMAELIIHNLAGYRSNSSHIANDTDALYRAITAIIELTKREYNRDD